MSDSGFVVRSALSLDTLEVDSFTTGHVMEGCDTSKSLACTNPENNVLHHAAPSVP